MKKNNHKFDLLMKRLDKIGIPQFEFNEFLEAIKTHCNLQTNNTQINAPVINNNNKEIVKKYNELDISFKQKINELEQKLTALQNENKILHHKVNSNKNYDDEIKLLETKINNSMKEHENKLNLNLKNEIVKIKTELDEQKKKRTISPVSRLPINRISTKK